MLGSSYVGRTYVCGLPSIQIVKSVPENIGLSENVKRRTHWVKTVQQSMTLAETNVDFLIVVLRNITESLHLADNHKYKIIAPIAEAIHILEKIKKHVHWHPIQEALTIADNIDHKICYFIEETISLTGRLFVNGKEVINWWQACLKKGVAEVTNVYHKFRGRGVL